MKNPVVQAEFQTKTRESIERFVEFIERMGSLLHHDHSLRLQSWGDKFLDEIGYFNELRRGEKDAEAAENRIRR